MEQDTELVMYRDHMAEVRDRLDLMKAVFAHAITIGNEHFDIELVFLHLRKVLELIAFSSLIANKAEYSSAYEKFASHWNAERMLRDLEKINPNFYPQPMQPPEKQEGGFKLAYVADGGFMTKDEFIFLYDKCGKMLHARNPFSGDAPTIQIGYSARDWVTRIQKLLARHFLHLVSGNTVIGVMTDTGAIQVVYGVPYSGRPD